SSANRGDIDRGQVWRVSVAGGKPQAVTSGTGIEWSPAVASDGKAIGFLRADARKPPRPAILTGSGPARELAAGAIPAEFPEAALVEPQQVLVSASDGVIVHGQLFLPRNVRSGERRSEEHTSELQSRFDLVCRLLLEKKKHDSCFPLYLPSTTHVIGSRSSS